jgi:hypothetical protein
VYDARILELALEYLKLQADDADDALNRDKP